MVVRIWVYRLGDMNLLPMKCLVIALALTCANVHAKGVAAVKAQSYHDDAKASVFMFESVSATSVIITFDIKGQKPYSIIKSDKLAYVEVVDRIGDITKDSDIEPYRKSLKECEVFTSKYTKSKPLLTPYIEMISGVVEKYDSGLVRRSGKWVTKEDFSNDKVRFELSSIAKQKTHITPEISTLKKEIEASKREVLAVQKDKSTMVTSINDRFIDIADDADTETKEQTGDVEDAPQSDKVVESVNLEDVKSKKRLNGQIFIVRKDRQNVKMGAVRVFLFDKAVITKILRDACIEFESANGVGAYVSEVSDRTERLNKMRKRYNNSPEISAMITSLLGNIKSKSSILSKPEIELPSLMWENFEARKDYYSNAGFTMDYTQWCIEELFEYGLKDAREYAVSDADGTFTLNMPVGQACVVVAKASRSVLKEDSEKYFWIVSISADSDKKIMLYNDNMLDDDMMIDILAASGNLDYIKSHEREKKTQVIQNKLGMPKLITLGTLLEFQKVIGDLSKIETEESNWLSKLNHLEQELERQKSRLSKLETRERQLISKP